MVYNGRSGQYVVEGQGSGQYVVAGPVSKQ